MAWRELGAGAKGVGGGLQGRGGDSFTDMVARRWWEPGGILKQQSDPVKPGFSNHQSACAYVGVKNGRHVGAFCSHSREEG